MISRLRPLRRWTLTCVIFGAMAALVPPASALADPVNELSAMNPSFRWGSEGWSGGSASSAWSVDGDGGSLHVNGTVTNNDASVWSEFVPINAGQAYAARISASVNQAIQGFRVRIEWWDNSTLLTDVTGARVTGLGPGTATVTGTAPVNATRARLRVYDDGTGTWDAYLDGAMIVNSSSVPSSFYFALPGNLLSPMNPSFVFGSEAWTGGSASNNWSYDGDAKSLLMNNSVTNNDLSTWSGFAPASENKIYSARVTANVIQAIQGFRVRIEWWSDTSPLSDVTGSRVSGTGAGTASVTGKAPSGTTRARLRVYDDGTGTWTAYVDAAMLVEGGVPIRYWHTPDSAPYATVRDSGNNIIGRYGITYQASPGGQTQLAINHAQCGNPNGCTGGGAPRYPKVVLDSGTFNLTVRSGIGIGRCAGIFLYSGVLLQGAPGATIDNNPSSPGCFGGSNADDLYAVILVGANADNLDIPGDALNVSQLAIDVNDHALHGLVVGYTTGPGLAVNAISIYDPEQSGILLGDFGGREVIGTAGSPALVTNSLVASSQQDGIVLSGQYIKAAGNTISDNQNHGIAVFSDTTINNMEVSNNTITGGSQGVSLDGSVVVGNGNVVFNNTMLNTCIGVIVLRQTGAQIAGNYAENPSRTYNEDCAGTEFAPSSVGIGVISSNGNWIWSNQVHSYSYGIWLQEAGDSPGGVGTRYNKIGVTPAGAAAGNWIDDANLGIRLTRGYGGANIDGNQLDANSITNSSGGCSAPSDSSQVIGTISANSFASC